MMLKGARKGTYFSKNPAFRNVFTEMMIHNFCFYLQPTQGGVIFVYFSTIIIFILTF